MPRESDRRAECWREGRVELGGRRVHTPLDDETNVSSGDGTPNFRSPELASIARPELWPTLLREAVDLGELLRAEAGTKSALSSSELSVDAFRRRVRLTGGLPRMTRRADMGRLGAIEVCGIRTR
jgi:hypothetical protein